jgi:hypothetical protein
MCILYLLQNRGDGLIRIALGVRLFSPNISTFPNLYFKHFLPHIYVFKETRK